MNKFNKLISHFNLDPTKEHIIVLSTDAGIDIESYQSISKDLALRFNNKVSVIVVNGDVRKVINIIEK